MASGDVKVNVTVDRTGFLEWEARMQTISEIAENVHFEVGILERATDTGGGGGPDPLTRGLFHERGTVRTPARPFVSRAKEEHAGEWVSSLRMLLMANIRRLLAAPLPTIRKAFRTVGRNAREHMRAYISNAMLRPLKQRTVIRKYQEGFTAYAGHPLARTGKMLKAINFEVVDGPVPKG